MTHEQQTILIAWCATQSASIALALNALADNSAVARREAIEAQLQADNAAFIFCGRMGLWFHDAGDRLDACREHLTENVQILDALIDTYVNGGS